MNASTQGDSMIDSHQHFWRLSRGDYSWLRRDLTTLYRDFEPAHLLPHLKQCGIRETIAVQAAPTVDETRFLLRLAQENDFIAGVVGWIDFEALDCEGVLLGLCEQEKFVGVRPMLQDIADPEWVMRPALAPAFEALMDAGLTFDALVRPHHLSVLLRLAERYPGLSMVLDHAAKPNIATKSFDAWSKDVRTLARETGMVCKLSGLVTEAGVADYESLAPYVDHVLECFGPARVMWGSDWPVCNLVCEYGVWFELSRRLLASLSAEEQACIYGDVARRFYGLPHSHAT
jgi:L-fuconolactonase